MPPPKRPTGIDNDLRFAGEQFARSVASALGISTKHSLKERTERLAKRLDGLVSLRQIERWSQGKSLLRVSTFVALMEKLRQARSEQESLREVEQAYNELYDLWHGRPSTSRVVYSSGRNYFGDETEETVDTLLDYYETRFDLESFDKLRSIPAVIQPAGSPDRKFDSADMLEDLEGLLQGQEDQVRIDLNTRGVGSMDSRGGGDGDPRGDGSNWVVFQILAEYLYKKSRQDREYELTVLCPIFVDLADWIEALEGVYPDDRFREEQDKGISEARLTDMLNFAARELLKHYKSDLRLSVGKPLDAVHSKRVVFILDAGQKALPLPALAGTLLEQTSRLIVVEGWKEKAKPEWNKVVTHRIWARPIDVRKVSADCRRRLREADPALPDLGSLGESISTLGNPEIAAQVEALIEQGRLNANALASESALMACLIAENLVDVAAAWGADDNLAHKTQFGRIGKGISGKESPELRIASLREYLKGERQDLPIASLREYLKGDKEIKEQFIGILSQLLSTAKLPKFDQTHEYMRLGEKTRHRLFYDAEKSKRTGLVDSRSQWIVPELGYGARFLLSYLSDNPSHLLDERERSAESAEGPPSYLYRFDAEAFQFLRFLYEPIDGKKADLGEDRIREIVGKTLEGLKGRHEELKDYYNSLENYLNHHELTQPGSPRSDHLEDLKQRWEGLRDGWSKIEEDWKPFMACLRLLRTWADTGRRVSRETERKITEILGALEDQFEPKFQSIIGQSNFRYFGAKAGAAILAPDQIAKQINDICDRLNPDDPPAKPLEDAGRLTYLAEVINHLAYRAPAEGPEHEAQASTSSRTSSGTDRVPAEGPAHAAQQRKRQRTPKAALPSELEGPRLEAQPGAVEGPERKGQRFGMELCDALVAGLYRMRDDRMQDVGDSLPPYSELRHARYHMLEALNRIAPLAYARKAFADLFQRLREELPGRENRGDATQGRIDRAVEFSIVVGRLLAYDRKLRQVLPAQFADSTGTSNEPSMPKSQALENLAKKLLDDVQDELIETFCYASSQAMSPNVAFHLCLMPSLSDAKDVPKEGSGQVIVANVRGVLHFRIFEVGGKRVADTDERLLAGRTVRIDKLRQRLGDLWGRPKELSLSDRNWVIGTVRSIVGHPVPVFDLASPIHSHIFDAHNRLGPLLSKKARTRQTFKFLYDVIGSETWQNILKEDQAVEQEPDSGEGAKEHDPAALEVLLLWLRNETRLGFVLDGNGGGQQDGYRLNWDSFLGMLRDWYRRASKSVTWKDNFSQPILELAWEILINCGEDPDGEGPGS